MKTRLFGTFSFVFFRYFKTGPKILLIVRFLCDKLLPNMASSRVKVWTPCAVTGPRGLNAANIDLLTHLSKMSGAKVLRADFQNEIATLVAGGQKLEGNLSYETRGKLGPYKWHNQAI